MFVEERERKDRLVRTRTRTRRRKGEEEKSQTHESSSQEAFMVEEIGMDEALSERLENTTREMGSARAEDAEKRKGTQEY